MLDVNAFAWLSDWNSYFFNTKLLKDYIIDTVITVRCRFFVWKETDCISNGAFVLPL